MFGDADPKKDALIAISGPLTHVFQVAFWCAVMALISDGVVQTSWRLTNWKMDLLRSLVSGAIGLQIAIFAFNLIPAFPLDGGRLLAALLSYCRVEANAAMRVSATVGGALGLSLLCYSLMVIRNQTSSFFLGYNSLFLSFFLLTNSFRLYRLAAAGRANEDSAFLQDALTTDDSHPPHPLSRNYSRLGHT